MSFVTDLLQPLQMPQFLPLEAPGIFGCRVLRLAPLRFQVVELRFSRLDLARELAQISAKIARTRMYDAVEELGEELAHRENTYLCSSSLVASLLASSSR